jgi:transcriptional regulator NrdR family protein
MAEDYCFPCPICITQSEVIDEEYLRDPWRCIRTHRCLNCGEEFETMETVVEGSDGAGKIQ